MAKLPRRALLMKTAAGALGLVALKDTRLEAQAPQSGLPSITPPPRLKTRPRQSSRKRLIQARFRSVRDVNTTPLSRLCRAGHPHESNASRSTCCRNCRPTSGGVSRRLSCRPSAALRRCGRRTVLARAAEALTKMVCHRTLDASLFASTAWPAIASSIDSTSRTAASRRPDEERARSSALLRDCSSDLHGRPASTRRLC